MVDDPVHPGNVASTKATVSDPGNAPFIYFEGVASFGYNGGVVNLTLATARHLMTDGTAASDLIAVAHLRCNIAAATELRNTLDQALLLAVKTGDKPN